MRSEKILRIHVWMVAAMFPLLVELMSMRTLMRLMEWPRRWHPYAGVQRERIVEIVSRRLRKPWLMRRRRCLRFGFTLFHFLRLAAVPSVLKVAVLGPVPVGRRTHAHGWVTADGVELDPPLQPAAVLLTCNFQPESER